MKYTDETRAYWIKVLTKIVDPVLNNLSQQKLKKEMNVEGPRERIRFSYLEALGRTAAGLAPWLELGLSIDGQEKEKISRYGELLRKSIAAGTAPDSPDYMLFDQGGQPLVDAAFLAHGIVRAPRQLWNRMDERSRMNLVKALKSTRKIKPCYNNWLLFSAMIETALYLMGEDFDRVRVDYALKEHENWYLGDGIYGDGPEFHWDYYNSFVIQPMLIDIVNVLGREDSGWGKYEEAVLQRARRYAEILERLIAPDGSFPPIGRSLTYRFGAFQLLSQLVLQKELPDSIEPAQIRCALTAVIKKMLTMPTFDSEGWLKIGFCGHQPELGERYITTGSLYLCTTVFLPLGLAPDELFWSGKEQPWTSKKIWKQK